MIIDIHLSNFYSINNDITLSLQAVNLRGKQALALKNHFLSAEMKNYLKQLLFTELMLQVRVMLSRRYVRA